MVFCTGCGAQIDELASSCPQCGRPAAKVQQEGGKSKTTAALLALFLGGVGVHKFYLGQTGTGILFLLFCWTLIPVILAFIDFFTLLAMSDEKFHNIYG
ncbi:MAG: NINE protein [Brevinema sp.]